MGRASDLSSEQQAVIKALSTAGKTQGEIARQVGCSQSAVSKCLQDKSSDRKKCGRKRVTSKRDDRQLERLVRSDRFQNCGEIAQRWNADGVPASRSTVYRRIKELGYANRIPRVKPLLNSKQRKKRLTWAKERLKWTVGQWSRVLFSDESKFCISFGNQGPRVWRKPNEADKPGCTKSSVKFPQSVMIWAGMSAAGVGPLCFLRTTVTAAVYQEVLEHFCFRQLSNYLGMPSLHSNMTWLLPIVLIPLRRGLLHVGYRSCLGQQTLRI